MDFSEENHLAASLASDGHSPLYQATLNLPFTEAAFVAVPTNSPHKPLRRAARLVKESTVDTSVKPSGTFEVHRADAISFLSQQPDNSIDLIITDPAYSGMNQKLKLGKGKIIGTYKDKGEEGKWFEEFHDTPENYTAFLRECYRVLKPNRHIYLMFDSYSLLSLGPLIRKVFDVKNILCWDKMHIGLGHYFRRRHELILFASKGKRPLNSKSIPDVWRVNRLTRAVYPTQKPTELFELMLVGSAEPGFQVCDPFMGSGAAGVAALRHGCHFIGCDISETALALATKRLTQVQNTGLDPLQKDHVPSTDANILKLLNRG